jgi:hypothetical protein
MIWRRLNTTILAAFSAPSKYSGQTLKLAEIF